VSFNLERGFRPPDRLGSTWGLSATNWKRRSHLNSIECFDNEAPDCSECRQPNSGDALNTLCQLSIPFTCTPQSQWRAQNRRRKLSIKELHWPSILTELSNHKSDDLIVLTFTYSSPVKIFISKHTIIHSLLTPLLRNYGFRETPPSCQGPLVRQDPG
jgi:hypothetical protein